MISCANICHIRHRFAAENSMRNILLILTGLTTSGTIILEQCGICCSEKNSDTNNLSSLSLLWFECKKAVVTDTNYILNYNDY